MSAASGDHVDGRALSRTITFDADVVVVGSGPAGATVARTAARAGARVLLLEAGPWLTLEDFAADSMTALARGYRDMGASLVMGRAPMPYLQGRMVGGSSTINGAISWRLPRDVHARWIAADPALEAALPFEAIDHATREIEEDLGIHPTPADIAGPNNLLLARGANALGIEHRPVSRNVSGCRGLGRCLQGCPEGHKRSMDRTYVPDALAHGATIISSCPASRVVIERARAIAVLAKSAGGATVVARGAHAIVLAASAIDTPVLLAQSGLRDGIVGKHFQCHPGVSMAGRFPEPVRLWTGATQGHEVIGLRGEGIKLEALGYDIALAASRLKGFGERLSEQIADLDHYANWGAAIRAAGEGRVRPGRRRPSVSFRYTATDVAKLRRSVRILGEAMLAAGADFVTPGVHGWHEVVRDRATMARFEEEGPLEPRAYATAVTHMFGTARMGSDPRTSVVRPDFRHHRCDALYVADSSVFPTNTGVNPQTSILAMAALCARSILRAERETAAPPPPNRQKII
jgi:choline dehydrogenase-like flavoprotein